MGGLPWLGSVLGVSFSALTLTVESQERHLINNKTRATYPDTFSLSTERVEEENQGGTGQQRCTWETPTKTEVLVFFSNH